MFKYLFLFLILLLFGWGSYFTINKQFYPAAIINFNIISFRNFENSFSSALSYYSKIKKPEVDEETFKKEVRRATLDKLIENELIYENISNAEIENQIASLLAQNQNLEKGAKAAYGLSPEVFRNFILKPQVASELLQAKLKDKGEDFANWLKNKKNTANIFLLTSEFKWTGEKIELK